MRSRMRFTVIEVDRANVPTKGTLLARRGCRCSQHPRHLRGLEWPAGALCQCETRPPISRSERLLGEHVGRLSLHPSATLAPVKGLPVISNNRAT
jgi:hypothetical protein